MENFFDQMLLEVIPSLRAVMAKKLLEHGFSQKEAAEKLGLTQPAISQYKRRLRGFRTDFIESNPEMMERTDSLARRLASGQVSPKDLNLELLELCKGFFG